jgi:hypothetical protein
MPQYLVLVFEDEAPYADPGTMEDAGRNHAAFIEANAAVLRGGNALLPSFTARSLRGDDGRVTVSDGPWRPGGEAFCGYYVLEADDIDAATAVAGRVPAPYGGVEVREIRPSPIQANA